MVSAAKLTAVIASDSTRTTYGYDLSSNRVRSVDPLGNIATTAYDAVNRPTAMIDPLGNPLDDCGPIEACVRRPIECAAAPIMAAAGS